jgi:riboflavin kinase/FMN adenylyltransferase
MPKQVSPTATASGIRPEGYTLANPLCRPGHQVAGADAKEPACGRTADLFIRLEPGCAVSDELRGAVVAIGNFDGVHLAHQALMERTKAIAGHLKRPAMALTFDPHPRIFFNQTRDWFELTPLQEKVTLLRAQGVAVSVLDFDARTAAMTARQFVESVLIDALRASCVVVGDDFKCGRDQVAAEGLVCIAGEHQLPVEIMPALVGRYGRVSSTAIRAAISTGDLDKAAILFAR